MQPDLVVRVEPGTDSLTTGAGCGRNYRVVRFEEDGRTGDQL